MIRNQGAGTESAEQRAQLERLLEETFMADTLEEYVSVITGVCSQVLMTVLTRSLTSEELGDGGRRAMSITIALYQKWSGQLTSLLDRFGNYRTTVCHLGDTLRCILPPGAVVYLNYMQPGTLTNYSNGYCFEVRNMNSANKGFYDTMIGCMVASVQAVLKVPVLYLAKIGQLNTKILALSRSHEMSGGNTRIIAPLTVGQWLETSVQLAPLHQMRRTCRVRWRRRVRRMCQMRPWFQMRQLHPGRQKRPVSGAYQMRGSRVYSRS